MIKINNKRLKELRDRLEETYKSMWFFGEKKDMTFTDNEYNIKVENCSNPLRVGIDADDYLYCINKLGLKSPDIHIDGDLRRIIWFAEEKNRSVLFELWKNLYYFKAGKEYSQIRNNHWVDPYDNFDAEEFVEELKKNHNIDLTEFDFSHGSKN